MLKNTTFLNLNIHYFYRLIRIILSVFVISCTITACNMQNSKTDWTNWSATEKGLKSRVRIVGETAGEANSLTVEIEFKNVSGEILRFFDFQNEPPGWKASASYFRKMTLGIKDQREPNLYHLLSNDITRIVELEPGQTFSLYQTDINAFLKGVTLIYDTKVVEEQWPGEYWKGRIEIPTIK